MGVFPTSFHKCKTNLFQRISISLTFLRVTDASLCCNGNQRIAQLCQSCAQQSKLIIGQPAGKRVGRGGNRRSPFAEIHRDHLYTILCSYRSMGASAVYVIGAKTWPDESHPRTSRKKQIIRTHLPQGRFGSDYIALVRPTGFEPAAFRVGVIRP